MNALFPSTSGNAGEGPGGGTASDMDGGDEGRGEMPSLSRIGQAVARLEDAVQRQLRRIAHARHELSSHQRQLDLLSIRFGRVCDTLAGLSNDEEHLKVKSKRAQNQFTKFTEFQIYIKML